MKATFIFVSVLSLVLVPLPVGAKHPTRYGNESGFWQTHSLIRGTVEHIEHRYGKVYHATIHVDECVGHPVPVEGRFEAEYTEPKLAENPFAGLKSGDNVLVLARPTFGRANVPNGDSESFAMMPAGKAVYRIAKRSDPKIEETMRIGRAIAIPGFRDRVNAISSIVTRDPNLSSEMKVFLRAYLDAEVSQTESDITNAKTLLGQLKIGPVQK